jgi:hypothetical protein
MGNDKLTVVKERFIIVTLLSVVLHSDCYVINSFQLYLIAVVIRECQKIKFKVKNQILILM